MSVNLTIVINYMDYTKKSNRWLTKKATKIWEEMEGVIAGTGVASLIEELLEVERELTLREEQPYD